MDPQFDSDDADVILRTSDGISLKVHTRILAEASPFFRDLFRLPQPSSDQSTPAVVDILERGDVARMLLMFTYNFMEEPQIDSLPLLDDVLGAALKYDMAPRTIKSLRRLLVSPHFMQSEPLRVYAIACRHNLEAEMKLASAGTLGINLNDVSLEGELAYMTVNDYHRLIILRHTRSTEAQGLLLYDRTVAVKCMRCGHGEPRWWREFVERARTELQRAPTTDVIFSIPFLAQVAAGANLGGCLSCAMSILASHQFLAQLKQSIDDLPKTIL